MVGLALVTVSMSYVTILLSFGEKYRLRWHCQKVASGQYVGSLYTSSWSRWRHQIVTQRSANTTNSSVVYQSSTINISSPLVRGLHSVLPPRASVVLPQVLVIGGLMATIGWLFTTIRQYIDGIGWP